MDICAFHEERSMIMSTSRRERALNDRRVVMN